MEAQEAASTALIASGKVKDKNLTADSSIVSEICLKINELVGQDQFAVGQAGMTNIKKRTSEHYTRKDNWQDGYELLYMTDNKFNIDLMETEVINLYLNQNPKKITNVNQGGGGSKGKKEVQWGLYLKLAQKGKAPVLHFGPRNVDKQRK